LDGSCSGLSTSGGFILRDWIGRLLKWGYSNYGITSITVANARAIRDGVFMTIQAGFCNIWVEDNNKIVIHAAQGAVRIPRHILHLIKDVQCWQDAGFQLHFNHTFREANRAANWTTKHGHTISHSLVAYTCFSPELQTIIMEDGIEHSFVRKGT